jgi:hypothetical protein
MRNDLIEEPGKAGLLVIQIGEKLAEERIKLRIRVGSLLQVLNQNLHIMRHVKALMPLLEQLLPIKDTGIRVSRPKKGHFRLGLILRGAGKITFFAKFSRCV